MVGGSQKIERLIQELAKMPTIGRRTAQRLALHLLKASEEDVRSLVEAIVEMKEKVGYCSECGAISESETCSICTDKRRNRSMI